jgi:hypothetical protein
LELETLIRGVFDKQRFLDLIQHFIVFEEDVDSDRMHKIIAGYHQFHAVNAAVEETLRASGMVEPGVLRMAERQRIGRGECTAVSRAIGGPVWSGIRKAAGKSFSMLFYAARIVRHPAMQNPTLVVLTDRNDLDDQLVRPVPALRTKFSDRRRCRRRIGSSCATFGGGEWRSGFHHDSEVHAGAMATPGLNCCRIGATSS